MLSRIMIYLKEMYPPIHFFGTYIYVFICAAALGTHLDNFSFVFDVKLHIAAFSVCMMSLMVRIMDEFKDYEDDLKNYPDRPLPSGRVLKKDLKVLQTFVISSFMILSLYNKSVFIAACICLIYGILMYKWFFMEEKMRKNLPLAFASHNPVVLFYFGYICTVLFEQGYLIDMKTTLIGIPLALTMTNWEISRKLRAPKDETEYTTYTKIWGLKNATLASCFVQTLIMIGVTIFLVQEKVSAYVLAVYIPLALFIMSKYFHFMKTHEHKKHFKLYAEDTALITQLSVLAGAVLRIVW